MFSEFFNKKISRLYVRNQNNRLADGFLKYNWIMNNRLAIGPIPKTRNHWEQLEEDGLLARFSCCFPNENIFVPAPNYWKSEEFPLPDHREQIPLNTDMLFHALHKALSMLNSLPVPMYLHCFAGQQRSAIMAIGLVCIIENKGLLDSMDYVKRCHKDARPYYKHLEILEDTLRTKLEEFILLR